MKPNESAIRALKDRVARVLGELDEVAPDIQKKSNYFRLADAARELHHCADDIQDMLGRLRPR